MVIAPQHTVTILGKVAAAAAAAYARNGQTVVETPLAEFAGTGGAPGTAIVAPEAGIVECAVGADVDPAAVVPGITLLAAAGWEVTLLVPCGRLGEAHRALRGRPVQLQPWWVDPGDVVRFGAPEVP